MVSMLKFFSLSALLNAILGKDGLGSLMSTIFGQFGLTDVFGLAVTYARSTYMSKGRSAVIAMATIKEDTLRTWAKATNADGDGVVAAGRVFASAFADLVGSFLPLSKR
jgi:hypothetical protein